MLSLYAWGVLQEKGAIETVFLDGCMTIHGGIEQKVDVSSELALLTLADGITALGRTDTVDT
ncbi:MAG: hypothetical protein LBP24_03635 [Coriobacteriales bacterium]|nr:hypothetical protein [Coriobacteriales bacterium]